MIDLWLMRETNDLVIGTLINNCRDGGAVAADESSCNRKKQKYSIFWKEQVCALFVWKEQVSAESVSKEQVSALSIMERAGFCSFQMEEAKQLLCFLR
jgi:hypothetical protein